MEKKDNKENESFNEKLEKRFTKSKLSEIKKTANEIVEYMNANYKKAMEILSK